MDLPKIIVISNKKNKALTDSEDYLFRGISCAGQQNCPTSQ